MRKLLSLIFAVVMVVVTLSTSSCNKETEGPVLRVLPNATQFSRQPGQLMEFTIQGEAKDGLKGLRITKNENNTITQTLLDTVLSGSQTSFTLPFQVPEQGVTQIYFVFTLEDVEGRKVSTPRRLVVQGAALLQETTGHILYSIHAGAEANRAFNISNGNAFNLTAETDSSLIDILDYDQTDDGVLARSLTSGNGLEFVRFDADGFNYSAATFASAQSAYGTANKLDIVSNIQVGDKIITKYSTNPDKFAVLDIVEIFDEDGSSDDRYRFNLKK